MIKIITMEKIHTFVQILGVTADNASNNDKMIECLAELIDHFPGAANQTRCFTHILNLVAKSVLRQFEAPKAKGRDAIGDAMKELAAVADELEDDGNETSADEEDGEEEEEDAAEGDDDDGPDERDGMSQDELAELEESVKPIRLVLTKVFKLRL
jgi:Skp family chaperone for outer membrane proteins